MPHLTLMGLLKAYQKKEISITEAISYYIARIEKYDPALNSFVEKTFESALAQAKRLDQKTALRENMPYAGLPIAHKDIFCTQGVKTACGSQMLNNFISPYDATLVEKLKTAGFILLGKTNMDEFAMGSANQNSYYGEVKNPWNHDYVPGGSSGGSAAAVAGNLVPAVTGSDTGGSIRQPAAFCNLTGLKPTYGRISRYGMIAFASSLDQAGPMTHTAEDAAFLLGQMAGHDPKDYTSSRLPVPDYLSALQSSLKGLRFGLPNEYFESTQLSEAVKLQLAAVIQLYKDLGVEFVPISLPYAKLALSAYYIIAPAEAASNLARYDGVRYGYRSEAVNDLSSLYQCSRSEAFGKEVKRRIMMGNYVLSAGAYDAYYLKAQKVRRLIQQELLSAFNTAKIDCIFSPTTPSTAFKFDKNPDHAIAMYWQDVYTTPANLAGLPALSAPAGFVDGLPIGYQLIGRYFDEALLLRAAHQLQTVTSWHLQLPAAYQ